jgi:hypothetical protein
VTVTRNHSMSILKHRQPASLQRALQELAFKQRCREAAAVAAARSPTSPRPRSRTPRNYPNNTEIQFALSHFHRLQKDHITPVPGSVARSASLRDTALGWEGEAPRCTSLDSDAFKEKA